MPLWPPPPVLGGRRSPDSKNFLQIMLDGLTQKTPGSSETTSPRRRERLIPEGCGHLGAKGAKMASFFTATDNDFEVGISAFPESPTLARSFNRLLTHDFPRLSPDNRTVQQEAYRGLFFISSPGKK